MQIDRIAISIFTIRFWAVFFVACLGRDLRRFIQDRKK